MSVPADLVFRPPETNAPIDHEDYVSRLQDSIQTAHEVARDVLKTHQIHMKRDYAVKIHTREYAVGDLIYVLDSAKTKGRSKKLDPPWKGPGIVIQKVSSYLYKVKLRNSVFITNHDRLKKCCDRKIPDWLRQCQHRLRSGENVLQLELTDTFCICDKPDDGRLMIQCDTCDNWYHGACVAITQEVADTLKTYICPRCQV